MANMPSEICFNSSSKSELHTQGYEHSASFVTGYPEMCAVEHCIGHNMFFLWVGQ
jgi:hypothetical protein